MEIEAIRTILRRSVCSVCRVRIPRPCKRPVSDRDDESRPVSRTACPGSGSHHRREILEQFFLAVRKRVCVLTRVNEMSRSFVLVVGLADDLQLLAQD